MFNRRYRHNQPPEPNHHSQGKHYLRQHSEEQIPKKISARKLDEDDSRKQMLKISNIE